MRNSTILKKQMVLEQFIKTAGNAQLACQNANVSRSQFYKWQEVDSEFKQKVLAIVKGTQKFAEDKILLKALEGNPAFLKKILTRANVKIKRLS